MPMGQTSDLCHWTNLIYGAIKNISRISLESQLRGSIPQAILYSDRGFEETAAEVVICVSTEAMRKQSAAVR